MPYVIYKTATAAQAANSLYYGWNYISYVPDPGRRLYNMPEYLVPATPNIESVQTQRLSDGSLQVTIGWGDSYDSIAPEGYQVLVSTESRDWNYDGESLPADLMQFKSSTEAWDPSMYGRDLPCPTPGSSTPRRPP